MIVQPRLVIVDGVPMSALVAESPTPRGVVVAIHGGGTTALYFDCPGHPESSLLHAGIKHGYTVIALDRPGYGSSAAYPEAVAQPEQRVRLAYGTVDRILDGKASGAGLFLLGHSGGCELAIRMAADDKRVDVIGIELAGTGLRFQPEAQEILKAVAKDRRTTGLRELLWHPFEAYPHDVLRGATAYSGAPPYEGQMVADWARQDFPALAPELRIPVHFSFAEHERVWEADDAAQRDIAALFCNAACFRTHEQPGAGHNLSLGYTAAEYHSAVFAFADEWTEVH